MKLNLTRDLVFFDIESTGLNILRDRILQIACVKFFKDGRDSEELSMLINPGIPISEEAMSVHGITPKDVANKPIFAQIADKLFKFFGDADLAGYNSIRFDIPMLVEEFARAGFDFEISHRRLIDVQRIFYKMEPRTLKAAVKYYTGNDFEEAHDALADVKATVEVFKGQLKMYEGVDYTDDDGNVVQQPIVNDIKALHDFTNDLKIIDVTQKLKLDHNGQIVFNFGKYLGQPVAETLYRDRNYYNWILEKEFSHQVKKLVQKLFKEYDQEQKQKKQNGQG